MTDIVNMETQEVQEDFLSKLIESKQLPSHVKNVEQAFTIAQMGKELGFAPMQSFHYVIPIQGKLSLSSKAIGALLRKGGVEFVTTEDGVYVYDDGTTSEIKLSDKQVVDIRTTIIFYRGDKEEKCTFTWNEAKAMKLTTKDNWTRMPKQMLWARCLSKGANRIGADHLLGLYSVDEMFDHTNGMTESDVVRNEDGQIIEIKSN